jgi:ferredoxin
MRRLSMVYWFSKKPRLTSITGRAPGLVALLAKRTTQVSPLSAVFHVGMVTAILTGILMEILYLTGLSGISDGWGWVVTWSHGFLGVATTIGFAGVLARFASNRFFRMAAGRMFYVDAAFIAVASVSGVTLLLRILGIWPAVGGWGATVHVISVILWLVVSLFGGGLVAHALATVVYRSNVRGARSVASFQAFNSACARCGKCVEVCPLYQASNEKPEEAPALKVRRYLNVFRKGAPLKELRGMAEDIYVCALCGLCVGVCPYSFRHYDLYTSLLAQVNKVMEGGQPVDA